MRQHLVRLDGEAKMLGRFGDPVLDGRLFYQLAESVIDFDGIQFRCVESQKFLLRKFLRVESGLPRRISPSGGANVEVRHMVYLLSALRGGASRDYTLRRFAGSDFAFVFVVFLGVFFSARGGASPWAAMLMASSTFSDSAASPANCGSFCFSFCTGSNRSPIFSTRASTSFASNTSRPASFFFSACSTSSQVTGVETVGCSRARRE